MRFLVRFVLYTALAFGANGARAEMALDRPAEALQPFATGGMARLVPAEAPLPLPEAALIDETDAPRSLGEFKGKVILVNFWATWCAPCRAELASLDRLDAALGGEDFAVVTIATGRNPLPAIDKLFAEEGITRLPILRDPDMTFSRASGVLGLPVSLIVDREGREIARLTGDAVWDGPEAQALIKALIAP
ncbi:TlpA disulfide reductase family protein [Frigidibacter sp. RF13]|uniref:TlpA disulfide reductase family protein n=1 Tax=Frigidibacter sp. RF13 TaxID=2997340 RepID=UPI00226D61B1|nr:TlpA disulfide reductase family protein [Frigidibacter sp. RF13]MCY1128318.1 TlpA disulfide reductase family protein [Frigidibacter sp. RF13]